MKVKCGNLHFFFFFFFFFGGGGGGVILFILYQWKDCGRQEHLDRSYLLMFCTSGFPECITRDLKKRCISYFEKLNYFFIKIYHFVIHIFPLNHKAGLYIKIKLPILKILVSMEIFTDFQLCLIDVKYILYCHLYLNILHKNLIFFFILFEIASTQ